MGRAILFGVQLLAVAVITIDHHVVGTINRHYFPNELPTVWWDGGFAAVISLVWLGPSMFVSLWKHTKAKQ